MPEPIQIDEKGNIILKINWKRMLKVVIILLLSWGAYYLPIPELTYASRICLMIFVGAAGFWVTVAIPPFATSTVATREMAKTGTIVSILGIAALICLSLVLLYLEF